MKLNLRRLLACVLAVMLCMAAISIPAFAEGGDYYGSELPANPNPDVIVPEGNMSLVSDISGEAANAKEFLTVVSKNGNYFYIIVDRSANGNNTVHFLNQVDEYDLLALLSEEEIKEYTQSQEPVPTPAPTPVVTPTPTEPSRSDNGDNARAVAILGLFAVLAALVFFYLRSKKSGKPVAKGNTNLDEYDFGDEDDDDLYAKFEEYDPDSEGDSM